MDSSNHAGRACCEYCHPTKAASNQMKPPPFPLVARTPIGGSAHAAKEEGEDKEEGTENGRHNRGILLDFTRRATESLTSTQKTDCAETTIPAATSASPPSVIMEERHEAKNQQGDSAVSTRSINEKLQGGQQQSVERLLQTFPGREAPIRSM